MAVDYFLKIDGIEGESEDEKHGGQIDVESWSWGATQAGTMAAGGGGGAGKVNMQDFHFTMKVNKASPKLMLSCAQGKHIPSVTFVARKAGEKQQEFMTYKLSDVLISSYQTGAAGEIPTDQVSLNFAKIEFEYQTQDKSGKVGKPVIVGYDVKKNVKV